MPEKYQEEIEEILKRVEDSAPPDSARGMDKSYRDVSHMLRPNQRSSRPRFRYGWRNLPTISTGKILLAGLVLLLLGFLWLKFLIWVGLGLLVMGYLLFFVSPRSISYEKRWRGQPLERNSSLWDQFKRWLKS